MTPVEAAEPIENLKRTSSLPPSSSFVSGRSAAFLFPKRRPGSLPRRRFFRDTPFRISQTKANQFMAGGAYT
jgi:hypothetical protein